MDARTSSSTPPGAKASLARRRRRSGDGAGVRFFLPKPGSSPATPELGVEMANEGEALIQAFRSGQPFYTLLAWTAVTEVNSGGRPVIVKQAVTPKQLPS